MSHFFISHSYFLIGIFGALGAILRFIIDRVTIERSMPFWAGTVLINTLGAFVLGILAESSFLKNPQFTSLRLGLMVGLCGGFTTFSSFSLNILKLIEEGNLVEALVYGIGVTVLGLVAVYLGTLISK